MLNDFALISLDIFGFLRHYIVYMKGVSFCGFARRVAKELSMAPQYAGEIVFVHEFFCYWKRLMPFLLEKREGTHIAVLIQQVDLVSSARGFLINKWMMKHQQKEDDFRSNFGSKNPFTSL